jgi:hypothetical protein
MSSSPEIQHAMQALGELTPIEVPTIVETICAISGASAVRGALGTVYFTWNAHGEPPLVVVDWTIAPIESALPTYLSDVFARLAALRAACRVVCFPEDIALYAEPQGLGKVVLIEAYKGGHDVREVREDIAGLTLEERATPALVYVHAGQVKFARPAFEKIVNFRGTAANHLRRQIAEYSIDRRADTAELLTAWCTGILLALEVGRS